MFLFTTAKRVLCLEADVKNLENNLRTTQSELSKLKRTVKEMEAKDFERQHPHGHVTDNEYEAWDLCKVQYHYINKGEVRAMYLCDIDCSIEECKIIEEGEAVHIGIKFDDGESAYFIVDTEEECLIQLPLNKQNHDFLWGQNSDVEEVKNDRCTLAPGTYRHFKGGLYNVLHTAKHTETGEDMVVYVNTEYKELVYVRPYEMFMSPVDKEKYPDSDQFYRFVRINN